MNKVAPLVAFTVLVISPAAIRPASIAGQQSPVFTSGVELVAVDFRALTSSGEPVTDLQIDEVTLKVDGRVRPLQSLQWIQLAAISGAPAALIPPPFGSNTASDAGRTVLVVLDDESLRTGREAPVRGAVKRFLSALSARDRVALVTMPYGGVKVDFTGEHDRIVQVLSAIAGQGSREESGSDAACRTRRTLEALLGLLDGLARPDGPTTIMFVTTGLAGPRRDAPVTLPPGRCELPVELFHQVGAAAVAARAQFYVIQPEDPALRLGPQPVENIAGAGFLGSDNQFEGIEHLSGVTAARRLHLATAGDDTLLRIARETAGYYLAAFVPERAERNNHRHRVDISVTRSGATIRALPEVVISAPDSRTRRVRTPQAMLRDPKVYRDLPLRAAGYVSQEADGRLKVIALAEPIEPDVELRSASAALIDSDGRLSGQTTADTGALAAKPLVAGLLVPPGTYRLRIAATDANGRGGTADFAVEARLVQAGTLTLSSMIVGLSRAGRFMPRLLFSREDVAIGHVEIYGDPAGARVAFAIEVAATPDGPAMLSIPGVVSETRNLGRRTATAAIPVGGLPSGDYVLRGVVSIDGIQAGRVLTTMRKTLTPP